jgi:hypothetical protein
VRYELKRQPEMATNRQLSSTINNANTRGVTIIDNRLSGKPLLLARGIWMALTLFALGMLAFYLPRVPLLLAQFETPCSDTQCAEGYLAPDALRALHSLGIPVSAFAIFYLAVFTLIPLVVWVAVGLFLAWRRSDDWMALLVSLSLILFQASIALLGLIPGYPISNSSTFGPLWFVLYYYFCQSLIIPVFALFPNGRFAPRWMVWLTVACMLDLFLEGIIPSNSPAGMMLGAIIFPLALALVICLAGSMVYRYVRIATPLERQQIKWLAFTLILDIILNWIGPVALTWLFPQFGPHSLVGMLYNLIWPVTFLGVPISISIAILRYRLWDIDRIINRVLVYGLLTGILAAVYIGLILGLQALLGSLLHESNAVVLVVSTLAIYALFRPLRARLQTMIDQRFYRRKYDAARTLAAFNAVLRSEVDLNRLSEHLLDVVQETMQPAHVSLWLSQTGQRGKSQSAEEGGAP